MVILCPIAVIIICKSRGWVEVWRRADPEPPVEWLFQYMDNGK
jgi:hypothetical protein